jgi:outer membrane protein
MKHFLGRMIAGVLLTGWLTGSAWAQSHIATVDLRKVFDNYWKTKQADTALKERAADMEKEHTNMLNDWKKAKEDYQNLLTSATDQAVSSDERERRKKSAEDKLTYIKQTEDTIAQYERQARNTLEEQRSRMRENILGEIRNVLNAKGKAGGFSLVIDTAAQSKDQTPIVLYTNNENDLTDALLAQLNLGAPADAPKSQDKNDTKKADGKKTDGKK